MSLMHNRPLNEYNLHNMKLTYASANVQNCLNQQHCHFASNISMGSHFAERMEKGLHWLGTQARATVCEILDGHDCCHAESACPLAVRRGWPWHLQSQS